MKCRAVGINEVKSSYNFIILQAAPHVDPTAQVDAEIKKAQSLLCRTRKRLAHLKEKRKEIVRLRRAGGSDVSL